MTKDKTSAQIRSEILSEYYSKVYQDYLFGNGPQAAGISYFERAIEKFWMNKDPNKVLEIGGGNGEHLKYLRCSPVPALAVFPSIYCRYNQYMTWSVAI